MNDPRAPNADIAEAIAAQKRIYRALLSTHMREWIHLDLSMGQLKTLFVLATRQAVNVSALADTLDIGKPAASVLVDHLVQLGLAARTEDAEDRRRTLVTLTPTGSDLVARLRQGGPERFMRWLDALAPDDLAALLRGLRALAAIAERDSAASPDESSVAC